MSRGLWLRFLAASVFFSMVLAGLYLVVMRQMIGHQSDAVQQSVYLLMAHLAEEGPFAQTLPRMARELADSPAMPVRLWVVDAHGRVRAASTAAPPPPALLGQERPAAVHAPATRGHFFSGAGATAVVRLATPEPAWLLIQNPGNPSGGAFVILAVIFVVTVIGAMFLSLLLVTLYLRGRSATARTVLLDLERGNLGARFAVDRLDALGGLMLNFNRMADEIERLVTRIRSTERARRDLLQELGHDLRTPLTSLRTALDTLALHGTAMPAAERGELCAVAAAELAYFSTLLEDLFFIAEIDEPRYRQQRTALDLAALLAAEARAVQARGQRAGIVLAVQVPPDACTIVGDAHLAARLLRNLMDNALRHAAARVEARVRHGDAQVVVEIEDDGPGMSAAAIASFGQRRSRRLVEQGADPRASLGLGSVIVSAIAALHGARLEIASRAAGHACAGTRVRVSFPA
jgi:signal transduction histidine kinase